MVPDEPRSWELRVPTGTIVKLLVTGLLVWAVLKLWPEVVFLSVSLLLAVALNPIVEWLGRRGIGRRASVALLAVVLVLVTGAFVALVLPPLAQQAADLSGSFPSVQQQVFDRIPADDKMIRKIVDQIFKLPSSPEVVAEIDKPLIWGRAAVSGLTTTFVVIITTLYLVLDGRRLYAWLLAYVPRSHRDKMAETVPEVSKVVYAYVRGQFITSALFTVFVAILLSVLKVPAVLPLAILAGICDVLPVVGIIVATAPAVVLAFTVSPVSAAIVLGLYAVYHVIETYFIVPRVYGSTLRLSTLTVILALIVGATLGGILGAVMVLPLVAAYPIIERIWLRDYLGREVLADHKALEKAVEKGNDTAVDAVLQGEKHPGERTSLDSRRGAPLPRGSAP
jgi:predicted PurR-regulated permease PerM